MQAFTRLLFGLTLAALLGFGQGALAQAADKGSAAKSTPTTSTAPPGASAMLPSVADLRRQLDRIPKKATDNSELREALAQIDAISASANQLVQGRSSDLRDLNAQLGELGPAPQGGATAEAPDVTRRRDALTLQRNAVDADIRLARLVTVDARQRGSDLLAQRRQLFEDQLSERAASPLGERFWSELAGAWPGDRERYADFASEIKEGLASSMAGENRGLAWLALVLAILIIVPGNLWAERGLAKLAARYLPSGRLRRSLLVIAIVVTHVLLVGLALHGLLAVLQTDGSWTGRTETTMNAAVGSCLFITFIVGLGRALISINRPSWRLPPLSDALARRLLPLPWLAAVTTVLVWGPPRLNASIDASFATVVATHVLAALAHSILIGSLLVRLRVRAGDAPTPADAKDGAKDGTDGAVLPAERPIWVAVLRGIVALSLVAIWVLLALGYVALASFVGAQLTWGFIVIAAFYVLFKFAADLINALVTSRSRVGRRLQASLHIAPESLDQIAVVLVGIANVVLAFYFVIALGAPLGTGPDEVYQRSGEYGTGVQVGEFRLVPATIMKALAVFVLGLLVLRVLKHWLERSYFPTTKLEPGMQSSITTLVGYAGVILVVALALSALGISINRIAWIASALSVGIGFGLQAIVQNFISGLILLAERPVRVGDWVVLDTIEGDVRRINVRATEIQQWDRSTVIVPNSEFITKSVRNMTLMAAEGRILIMLPLALDADVRQVQKVVLAACTEHPSVLNNPAPSVALVGIENGLLTMRAVAYVASARLVFDTRSDILFAILEGLRGADLHIGRPTVVVAGPGGAAAAPHAAQSINDTP